MSITFESGRSVDPNCGFIGLNPELEISGGYDGRYEIPWISNFAGDECFGEPYSREDALELADIMIARWTAYREKF